MKMNLVTNIEEHPGYRYLVSKPVVQDNSDDGIYGVDLQKVIIAATDRWKGHSVGSISIGFSPTFDRIVALKD